MSKYHFSFWLITSDWHPGQKGLSQRPHEDTLQHESSAVIQTFLTISHLQIKISRCLACFLHCSCLPLETAACALTVWRFLDDSYSSTLSPIPEQSLLSNQSNRLKKKIWAALAFSSCKRWTLSRITSFARCSSSSVNQLKKKLLCQGNIQAWIWLMAVFIYLFICFGGRLSCVVLVGFFFLNSGRTLKQYFEKCYKV